MKNKLEILTEALPKITDLIDKLSRFAGVYDELIDVEESIKENVLDETDWEIFKEAIVDIQLEIDELSNAIESVYQIVLAAENE